jgi:adenylate cyclase
MKQGIQMKLRQLAIIIGMWMVVGFFMTVYEHLVLITHNSAGTSAQYSFLVSVYRNVGAGLIGGILGGSVLVFFVNVRYQDKPYVYTIAAVSLVFLVVVGVVTVVMGITIVPARTGKSLFHPETQAALLRFLSDPSPLKACIAWSFIVAITQLFLQISFKFGQGTFTKILFGKYQTPKEEKRVFMFLDINSSTSIAERIGDRKYHSFLKDFFADITQPILENKGEIYQYAGDEVIIAWTLKEGVENNQSVKCFFDIKQKIADHAIRYRSLYGVVPSFKAGIHCGNVIAGEVGIIKRDITYSGDVLNTTARVQSMCKEFKVDLIVSGELMEDWKATSAYTMRPLGLMKLRGKEKDIMLNAVLPAAA